MQGHEKEYIAARMEDQTQRHQKFANNIYLQEPDVKRGCGGLRDYQNLLWISYFKEGALTTTHLVGKDWLSAGDRRRIDLAYDFLLRVRTQLHYTNERTTDVLHLSLQSEVARQLGYDQKTPVARSEAFMKDYYAHTRNIFRITERLTERFATGTATTTRRLFFPLLPRRRAHEEHFENFFSRDGQLHVSDPQLFVREPEQMMKAFEHAQERKLELSADLTDALGRRLRLRHARVSLRQGAAGNFRTHAQPQRRGGTHPPPDARGRFPRAVTCRSSANSPASCSTNIFIVIPPMNTPSSASTNSTRCATTEDPKLQPYRKLFETISDPYVLYLALLLHDTGKGVGARPHSEASALFAQGVAVRLQLSSGATPLARPPGRSSRHALEHGAATKCG